MTSTAFYSRLLIILCFSLIVSFLYGQEREVKTLLNFDDKTIRLCLYDDIDPEVQILTVWDKNYINLISDPVDPQNSVMIWEKNNTNQTYGGFALGIRDVKVGLDLKDWRYFTYKIKAPQPVSSSILKFVKDGDILIYHDSITITADANKWYKVEHIIDESLYEQDNPIVIIIHPAGGEEIEGQILIDDISLER